MEKIEKSKQRLNEVPAGLEGIRKVQRKQEPEEEGYGACVQRSGSKGEC